MYPRRGQTDLKLGGQSQLGDRCKRELLASDDYNTGVCSKSQQIQAAPRRRAKIHLIVDKKYSGKGLGATRLS